MEKAVEPTAATPSNIEVKNKLIKGYRGSGVSETTIGKVFEPLEDVTKLESPELDKAWNEVWNKFESKQADHMQERSSGLRNHVTKFGLYHPDDPISFFEEAIEKAKEVETDKEILMSSIFDRPEVNDTFNLWIAVGSPRELILASLLDSASVQEFAEKFEDTIEEYKRLVGKWEIGQLTKIEMKELIGLEATYPKIEEYVAKQNKDAASVAAKSQES